MANSLLAHLYSHIKGSQEDVATLSLQYLLSNYEALKHEFNVFIGEKLHCDLSKVTNYICQAVGEENERPDISGRDEDGKEIVLCEAKFYAGLTDNQPRTYLERLEKEHGAGLLFICPKDRMISLWDKILSRCGEYTELYSYCVDVNGVRIALSSWDEINRMLLKNASARAKESISDIEQLEGYCSLMESEAFIPLKSENLGSDTARLYERFMYILDKVTDSILADPSVTASTRGLKATSHRHGYKRFVYIDEFGVDLRFDLQFWADNRNTDTPYWICFRDRNWQTTDKIKQSMSSISDLRKAYDSGSRLYLALDPMTNAFEDDLVDDLKRQIFEYIKKMREKR